MNIAQVVDWYAVLTGLRIGGSEAESLQNLPPERRLLAALASVAALQRMRFRFVAGSPLEGAPRLPALPKLLADLKRDDLPVTHGTFRAIEAAKSYSQILARLGRDPLFAAVLHGHYASAGQARLAELAAAAFLPPLYGSFRLPAARRAPTPRPSGDTDQLRARLVKAWDADDLALIFAVYHRSSDHLARATEAEGLLLCARAFQSVGASQTAYLIAVQLTEPRFWARLSERQRRLLRKLQHSAALRSGLERHAGDAYDAWRAEHPSDWRAHVQRAASLIATAPEAAVRECQAAAAGGRKLPLRARLLWGETMLAAGDVVRAQEIYDGVDPSDDPDAEVELALGALAFRAGRPADGRARLRGFFDRHGLDVPEFSEWSQDRLFGIRRVRRQPRIDHPKVSVIMTAFNAAATVGSAVESVLDQTFGNLELIVVDDASSDQTVAVLQELAAEDPRMRVLRLNRNGGAYRARNHGLEQASGAFVTFHDADDWMHPLRIEEHLASMTDARVVASKSAWIRARPNGAPMSRHGGGYIHDNPASTFVRKEAFNRLGGFDCVKAGADTEFDHRLKLAFGGASFRRFFRPLALGLQHELSLTRGGATAFDHNRHSPVRLEYAEAWVHWHARLGAEGGQPFLALHATERAFPAPEPLQ